VFVHVRNFTAAKSLVQVFFVGYTAVLITSLEFNHGRQKRAGVSVNTHERPRRGHDAARLLRGQGDAINNPSEDYGKRGI
jgi:hypothetical protein